MSKLLINEPPLQVLPSLAKLIGLNEAIFIQQLHYWAQNPKGIGKNADGRKWIRNTITQWRDDNFSFWSERTIMRVITNLEKRGLLLTRNDLNVKSYDRTNWYAIDFNALDNLAAKSGETIVTTCQDGIGQVVTMESDNLAGTIPETTHETTKENSGADAPRAGLGDGFRSQLMAAFLDKAGFKLPSRKNELGFWWSSIAALLDLCDGDLDRAIDVMGKTIGKMRADGLTIKGPNSLIGIARDLLATPALPINGQAKEPDFINAGDRRREAQLRRKYAEKGIHL